MKITARDINSLHGKQVFWVLVSVVIATAPHLPRLPVWFPLLVFMVVTTRWLAVKKLIRPLPGYVVGLLTIFIFLVIIYVHGFGLNRELSVTILTTMTVLKLLETWRKRDAWMVVTLCYFVILTRFFYSQDMLLIFYLLASVLITTHTLFILQHIDDSGLIKKYEIKQTASLLIAGLPLAALFFLFFPRLGSPIWGSPDFFGEGKTGISDEMSPGSITQLFNDDSTAFRAIFQHPIPQKSDLYWRGPVLWDFDGKTWTRNKDIRSVLRDKKLLQGEKTIEYEIELEPTGQKYLFALDYVSRVPLKSDLKQDSQLLSETDVNQLRHYSAASVIKDFNTFEVLNYETFHRLVRLPKGFNPKTTNMMREWKSESKTELELVQRILNWFSQEEFYYSFTPPPLSGNTVDQFLFETRSGFCEHYASAFTFMMRAAGIPARVVTGYQGGINNGGYLLIKQSDAHAWSEIWIQGKGWMRVDPTAAVSPLRVEQGSQALMTDRARNWVDSAWYRKLGEKYDRLRHKWNQWIRDYNVLKQRALFHIIGFEKQDAKAIAIVLGSIMLITTVLVVLFLYLFQPKIKKNKFDKIYNRFIQTFRKKGLYKPANQGITAFSELAKDKFPELQNSIDEFVTLYLKLRFSDYSQSTSASQIRLKKLIESMK